MKFVKYSVRCCARCGKDHAKPLKFKKLRRPIMYGQPRLEKAIGFLKHWRVKVLNVAGNSEQTSPGIYKATFIIMMRILETP